MTTPLQPRHVIVSLTSIRKRETALRQTLHHLLQQDCTIAYEIRVNLSHEPYLLDEGFECEPAWLSEVRRLNPRVPLRIDFVRNTGPYRKLLPVLATIRSPQELHSTVIVTCDDDTAYASDWLSTLLRRHSVGGGVVSFRGHAIKVSPDGDSLLPYAQWQANTAKSHFGLENLPTGKDGVLYRPYYFGSGVLDVDTAMRLAPTADDLWFRWHSLIRGVPCHILNLGDRVFDDVPAFDRETSLWQAFNKSGGNDRTVERLEQHFRQRHGRSVSDTLQRYRVALSDSAPQAEPETLASPSWLAAHQVRFWSLAQGWTETEQAVSARSYELMSLCQPRADERHETPSLTPRIDRGAMLHARQQVDLFDSCYGELTTCVDQRQLPLVTVVMTTHNASSTLMWAASSVLQQDHARLELIIVDDCSTDSTPQLLRTLADSDSRVRPLFLQRNRGTYFAKNVGLLQARGEFITFQDADDWSHPARLRLQLWRLRVTAKSATRCNYVRHHATTNQLVRVNGRVESPGFITLMAQRRLFDRLGFFDCSRRAADDELISRIEAVDGAGAVDLFALPAYVALYSSDTLIADSSTYAPESGLRFQLNTDRDEYQKAYRQFHARLGTEPDLIASYRFPPREIFIEKRPSLQAFTAAEIAGLQFEIGAAEVAA
jgi:hypothetical protein